MALASLFVFSCTMIIAQPTINPTLPAQFVERWKFHKTALGRALGNETSQGSYIMPEVMRLSDGTYRMYYTINAPTSTAIKYADSPDALNWTVKGTVLQGSPDSTNREFIIGGASLVRLSDGRFRMYYRTTEKITNSPPKYCLRSAISSDGVAFTRESGVRIENSFYDAVSPVSLAGHAGFYTLPDGTFAALFSGDPKGMPGPSDVFFARSVDGLTWNYADIRKLYDNWVDPFVIKRGTRYFMYAGLYVGTPGNSPRYGRAISEDGINWSRNVDSIAITDANGRAIAIADMGGIIRSDNSFLLYSNYGTPSADIAIYTLESTTGVKEERQPIQLSVSPNLSSEFFTIHFTLIAAERISLKILNVLGQEVAQIVDETLPAGEHSRLLDIRHWALTYGVYCVHLQTVSMFSSATLFVVR